MSNSIERFKVVQKVIEENNLCLCSINMEMFEKLYEKGLIGDASKVQEVISTIKALEERLEKQPNKYPEDIMQFLRQRRELDKYDTSNDDILSEYEPRHAFSEVCLWNGLRGSYDQIIKSWVEDIFKVKLENYKEKEPLRFLFFVVYGVNI